MRKLRNINIERIERQNGFTTIELIIVFVLVGLLTITAFPTLKYLYNTPKAAKGNKIFAESLAKAVTQSHELWLTQGNSTTVSLENGAVIHMNTAGWPDGMGVEAQANNEACVAIWNNLLQNPTQAVAGIAGCGDTEPCYNAVYEVGPPETCTYQVNNHSSIKTIYTISGSGAGRVAVSASQN